MLFKIPFTNKYIGKRLPYKKLRLFTQVSDLHVTQDTPFSDDI